MRTRFKPSGPVLVALAVAALVLGSCTTTTSQNTSGTAVTSNAIKPYGSLTIGVKSMGGSGIDPYSTDLATFTAVGPAVVDSLAYYDDKNQLQPGIAERWEISPDGKSHMFYIRKGVMFHNGDDLSGADVKFSIDRQLSPDNVDSDAVNWRAVITSVELKDNYTVALHLKTPQFEFLQGFDTWLTAVVPKKYIEERGVDYFRAHPVGSGPWRVVSVEPGSRLELEANENYWDSARVPKFKNITLLRVSEAAAGVAMLKTGELDLAVVATDAVPGLKTASLGIDHWSAGAEIAGALLFDGEHPDKYAFGDVRVRKAVQLGVNNQEIIEKLFSGYAEPYVTMGVDPNGYYFDPNQLKVDPYDAEQAKKLLAEAGYPSGFNTRMYDTGGGSTVSTVILAVSGYWRKIGVAADVIPLDPAAWQARFKPKLTPEVFNSVYLTWTSTGPRQFQKMVSRHSTQGFFRTFLPTPRLDELIDKVPTITDPVEKKKLALEAAVLAHDSYTVLSLVVPDLVVAHGSKVGDMAHFRYSALPALAYGTITHAR